MMDIKRGVAQAVIQKFTVEESASALLVASKIRKYYESL